MYNMHTEVRVFIFFYSSPYLFHFFFNPDGCQGLSLAEIKFPPPLAMLSPPPIMSCPLPPPRIICINALLPPPLGSIGSDKERWLWGLGIRLSFDIRFVLDTNPPPPVWLPCPCDKPFVIPLAKPDPIPEPIPGGCCAPESAETMDPPIKII